MIYQVYKCGGFVGCLPRWIIRHKPGEFSYEYLYIYRGPISGLVGRLYCLLHWIKPRPLSRK